MFSLNMTTIEITEKYDSFELLGQHKYYVAVHAALDGRVLVTVPNPNPVKNCRPKMRRFRPMRKSLFLS